MLTNPRRSSQKLFPLLQNISNSRRRRSMSENEENAIHEAEWSLIEDTEITGDGNDAVSTLAKQVLDAEYIAIFKSDLARRLLRTDDTTVAELTQDEVDIQTFSKDSTEAWYRADKSSALVKDFQILALGISCLRAFLQANFTGPFLPFESLDLLSPAIRSNPHAPKILLDSLSIDGERPYHLTPHSYF